MPGTSPRGKEEDVDLDDPDYIAATPPPVVEDAEGHFQRGPHADQWMEYDERGVPTRNAKKKKPSKKERDELEQEYLNAKKKYLEYVKEHELWEQRVVDAEAALERRDRFRWAFRQIGDQKNDPIEINDLEELLTIMDWFNISQDEYLALQSAAESITNEDGKLELAALRVFTKETMPLLLMEERLRMMKEKTPFKVELLHSPRTWRKKLASGSARGDSPRKTKSSKSRQTQKVSRGSTSPRGKDRQSVASPRGSTKKKDKSDSAQSPRSRSKEDADAPRSPRGGRSKKSVRG